MTNSFDNLTEDSTDSRVLLSRLWQKRWWIVVSTVLITVGATVTAFLMTPIYRASTVMISSSSERSSMSSLSGAMGQLGGLASLAGINVVSGDSETEEALAVLRSRQFTEKFISEKNLMPKLYPDKWNKTENKWGVSKENQPTQADAYKYFDQHIRSIMRDKKTGLVILQIDWRDRNEAAEWSGELVQRLNAEMRTRAIAKAEASVGYLQQELTSTGDVGTREAINRLIESQVKQRMFASVTQEYAFRVIDWAMAPDAKDTVRPIKALLVLLGLIVGMTVGCASALCAIALQGPRKASAIAAKIV